MGAVWLLVIYLEKNGKPVTVGLAVEGHAIGEMASAAFTFLALLLVPPQKGGEKGVKREKSGPNPDSGSSSSWETARC